MQRSLHGGSHAGKEWPMRKWIGFPHREGTISRQAHADLPAEGIYEREVGRSGFFGPATHLHHKHPPTGWSAWEGPLKPRAFDLNELPKDVAAPGPHRWCCITASASCVSGPVAKR
jgi:homogentisate 1,2-dioxygenase